MNIHNLNLHNFRNYSTLSLDLDAGVNLIVGDNAQGKTNLLEAVIYMGSGKSFRTQKTAELVKLGADFGEISGSLYSQEREQSLRWLLFPAARPRQLFLNGIKKKTAGDISGVLQTVLFCPEDLMVLKSGASARRKLGDTALCQLRPNYEAALTEYGRILEQKNKILKDRYENPALLEILPEYNYRLCQVGALIISYRARFYQLVSFFRRFVMHPFGKVGHIFFACFFCEPFGFFKLFQGCKRGLVHEKVLARA